MKKIVKLSQTLLGFSVALTLVGCAHHQAMAPVDTVQSNAVSASACANNTYLKQYNCSLQRVEQAAETNEPDAEYALGYMYYNGIGTVKDPETAMVWIKRAAEQGQPLAIDALKTIHQAQFPTMGQVNVVHPQTATKHTSAKVVAASTPAKHQLPSLAHLNSIPKQHYTVQLIASPNLTSVQHLENTLPKTQPTTIASTKKQNKIWYLLLVGNFSSKQQAQQYVQSLPAAIQKAKPWIRTFASLDKG